MPSSGVLDKLSSEGTPRRSGRRQGPQRASPSEEQSSDFTAELDLDKSSSGEQDDLIGANRDSSGTSNATDKPMGRRKVGRPILYTGNPEDPALSDSERRRIKRRIANRESARRVRKRRQLSLDELQAKMWTMNKRISSLQAQARSSEKGRRELQVKLDSSQEQLASEQHTCAALRQQLRAVISTQAPRTPQVLHAPCTPGPGMKSEAGSYAQLASPAPAPPMAQRAMYQQPQAANSIPQMMRWPSDALLPDFNLTAPELDALRNIA